MTAPVPFGQAVLNQGVYAAAVTASDTTVVGPTRGIYVGTSSSAALALVMWADNSNTTVTFKNVIAGTYYPFNVKKVMAATTASDIVAVY
jgi:hypothetical protein